MYLYRLECWSNVHWTLGLIRNSFKFKCSAHFYQSALRVFLAIIATYLRDAKQHTKNHDVLSPNGTQTPSKANCHNPRGRCKEAPHHVYIIHVQYLKTVAFLFLLYRIIWGRETAASVVYVCVPLAVQKEDDDVTRVVVIDVRVLLEGIFIRRQRK